MDPPPLGHAHPDSHQAASGRRTWLTLLISAVGLAVFVLVVWPWFRRNSPGGDEAGRTAGFVLDVKGDWICRQNGERPLAPGDELPTGAHLEPHDPANAPWIRLILRNGADETYSAAIDLPHFVEPRMTSRFWDALVNNYTAVLRADTLVARGDEPAASPLDGPVRNDGQTLDFSTIFAPMPAGTYQVSMYDLDPRRLESADDSAGAAPRFNVAVTWDPERPQPATVRRCPPGLFRAEIAQESDDSLRGMDFWILVAPAEHFDAVQGAYANALSSTARSGAGDDPAGRATARWLRRATLVTLATTDANE